MQGIPMNISMKHGRLLVAALLWASAALSHAAPMGFKDSWMAMGDLGPNWREAFVNYAYTARDAVGGEATVMRADDKRRTVDLVGASYTRLLQRWNMTDAQANIWFFGGLGSARINDSRMGLLDIRTMVSPGVQLDYETTRVYVAATARLYRARAVNHDYVALRAGFSFYEAEYDQTQPWLIVEARRMRGLSDKTEITPMLRLINKDFFVEAGVNNSSQLRLNFMHIF